MRKQKPNALTRQIQRADKGERFRNSGRWWCCGAASANRGGRKQDDGDPSATHIRTSCAAGGGVANATPRSPRLRSPGDRLSRPPPPLHAPAPKPRPPTRAARFWVTPGAGASRHHRSPELHRRPELESANNNPLKRKGDVDQQPYSRLEPVGLRQSSLESASASRARVWAASHVNAVALPHK